MRMTKALTLTTTLLAAAALTGCGGDAASGPMAGLGLPKADDMAGVAKLLNAHTVCRELESGSAVGKFSEAAKEFNEEVEDPAYGIEERGICKDDEGRPVTLLLLPDMEKFQTAVKNAEGSGDSKTYLVGQNFAVIPVNDRTTSALKAAGLFTMSCNPDHKSQVPSGFKVEEPLVKGCFVTDFFPS
ncbi:hypothetical protein [Streptomyces sp. NPDC006879]|uniref:hypothetical protein n=1 Tax=Streptomyces sp. NPDC006879 TaxID=3364767 RepID=UPI003699DB18